MAEIPTLSLSLNSLNSWPKTQLSLSLNFGQKPNSLWPKTQPSLSKPMTKNPALSLFLSKSVVICGFRSWVLFIDLGFEF